MEEQLIELQTAKLAKEKKFDVQCIHGFVEDISDGLSKGISEEFYWELGDRPDDNYFENLLNYDQEDVFFYSRPTQSLLQKWLREKHEIYVDVLSNLTNDDKINFIVKYYYLKKFKIVTIGNYSSYEKALEKGLQEALKIF